MTEVEPTTFNRTLSDTTSVIRYSDEYTYSNGLFTLVEPIEVTYSEATLSDLVGKYFISKSETSISSTTNSNYLNKFSTSQSDITSSSAKYGAFTRNTQTIEEKTLSEQEDQYTATTGKNSYYFRGNVNDNYLEFNNMCWRVVRIEGDGSIKLILAKYGLCSTITEQDTVSGLINNAETFSYNDMSSILETWYESTGLNTKESTLKEDIYCDGADRNYYNMYDGNILTADEESRISWGYGDYNYVYYNHLVGKRIWIDKTVSLKCDNESPSPSYIGTLTADEVVLAGILGTSNSYLNDNASSDYLTYSYGIGDGDGAHIFYVSDASLSDWVYFSDYTRVGIRPTITLLNTTLYTSGSGLVQDPYIVE